MEILQIKNLSFSYPNSNKRALDNISLNINEGDFVIICGESGCGKSTLLRLIKKEISPYGELDGSILYKNENIDIVKRQILSREIGFVMQDPNSQIITHNVSSELAFGLESLGYDSPTIRRKVAEMSSYFGIESWFSKSTNELSGGQKQILNLASIMVMGPKLILLDEPTAQLDPIASSNFIDTLNKINKDLGITVIMIEHNLEQTLSIADRVVLMSEGQLKFNDNPKGIAKFIKNSDYKKMAIALPTATRIYEELSGDSDNCPLTVKACRDFITENYSDKIKELDKTVNNKTSSKEKLKLKNVCFRYEKDSKDILKDVNLVVNEGEHFCLLGGNGSGKSTTLNIIAGLLKPYSGKVYIDSKRINNASKKELYKNNIALLPQNPQDLFIEDNVYDDLLEVCKNNTLSNSNAKNRIDELTQKLRINHLLNIHPYDLSGGEMQKVAIVKLLLGDPKLLLLDEPTKGIDAFSKQELGQILAQLKGNGKTIITVTHDIEFAARYADRCGLFFDSSIVSTDEPYEFFSKNGFYTTSANKISRNYFNNAILYEDVVELCKLNKGATNNE